jgi:endonuclease/exonuclease/phosphatase (EEP) superfamily protein YafD
VKIHERHFEQWIADASGRPGTIVLGDFNLTPWSPRFRDALARSGLTPAGDYRLWPRTFPAMPAARLLFFLSGGIPIDHVLVSGDLGVSRVVRGPFIGSDHYPVYAELFRR